MPAIDPARVLSDLYRLREFGAYKSGVHRPSLTPQDIEARRWMVGRMREAGLDATIDGIGTVFGRAPARSGVLLTGSHLESQNHAGWLDGALGVVYGLEAARALGLEPGLAGRIDVASWFDEEGHFGHFLGSRSFIGLVEEADMDRAVDRTTGTTLRDALAGAGLAGRPRVTFAADPARHIGYAEAHIEQGDTLESEGKRIGVVTAIVAIWQFRIRFTGTQNHAGTTRMAIRRDAGLALVKLADAIDKAFPAVAGPRTVWTTGRITLDPGQPSVIPGGAEMLFQFRDADPERLVRLEQRLQELVAEAARGPCGVELQVVSKSTPALMTPAFQEAFDDAAERHAPGQHIRMPSGAGHDAQYLARKMPAAMLFVPSIGGISHHWTENTSDEDLVLGAQVFADGCTTILKAAP